MSIESKESWSIKMVAPLEPGIVCVDIERMLAFYTEVLGLTFVSDAEATAELSTKFGTSPNGFRIIRLQTPYGERIKLVQPKKVPPHASHVPQWVFEGQGIAYITFVVADVHEAAARLERCQVAVMSEGTGQHSERDHRNLRQRSGRKFRGICGIRGSRVVSARSFQVASLL